ncbi:PP2C family protein-serine/threonine phosphatase [Luteolibacter luteus]|uniref:SpoIIE family protein phosphatase n=1 Tax=Luteolibacter luteus TaxID=2728835 RepID=A0A858RJ80_9BACT|nr:SpoIIE family protein phosphatase [Luteolibacter luteus]QJE96538.1 SpoIIE family protein phosphatase [Luteolibacter luteus]
MLMIHPGGTSGSNSEDAGRLVLALRASNEGIWDWWTGNQDIYYSRRILEFFECSPSTAPNIFLEPHEMIHEEDRPRFSQSLKNALSPSGPELFAIDCRLKTGGNHWRWLRIRGTVVRTREGQAQRIAGSMIDISLRKEAEAQIEEERHLLRMLIDHVPLQVYFKDRESRFVLANKQMAEWMGLKEPRELTGKHDSDFFAEEHWEQAAKDERRIMESLQPVNGKVERETWRGDNDGEDTWVLTSKFPWVDRGGEVKGTFGVSSDVTELVRAKQEATELAAELRVKNQAYEEELQLAREIQQTLAGSNFPEVGDGISKLRFGARYLPISGMAGDFFEVLRISDDKAGVLICDVMGHGVRSALVVAMLRGLLEKQRRSASDPSAFLSGLNSGLAAILDRAGATMFATAFYAVADLGTGVLRYACAGHPGAIATGPGGVQQLAATRKEKGPGLGLIAKAEYPAGELRLAEVSRILLFTDGILEAENEEGEPFLEKRLMETAADCRGETLEEMLDIVLTRVLQYSDGHHFDDDVCLLGMELVPTPVAAE